MAIQNYDELLSKLREAFDLCYAVGLSKVPVTSRFSFYEDRIRRLQELSKRYQSGSMSSEEQTNLQNKISANVFALVEAVEFVNVVPYLRSQPEEIVRWKLRNVLKGPSLPSMEDQNSNEARNTLFELNLASKFSRAGINTVLGLNSDICCDVEGKSVLVECKRPLSSKSITKNVRDARKALNRHLRSAPVGSRGVIAISFSRIINPIDEMLRYIDEESAKHYLADIIDDHVAKIPHKPPLGNKIIGLLFHVIIPAVDIKNNRLASGEQINAQALKNESSIDYDMFFAIAKAVARLC